MSQFIASKYQTQIFEDIKSNNIFNIVVTAVPGSGKSETIKQAIPLIAPDKSILVCAFNSDAAASLSKKVERFSNVNASTIHSAGKMALLNANRCGATNNFKYNNIIKDIMFKNQMCMVINEKGRREVDREVVKQVAKFVGLIRLTLVNIQDMKALQAIIRRFDIELDAKTFLLISNLIPEILNIGKALVQSAIDFTDMIYLPLILNLPIPQYDYVFVDECQDLSPCSRKLMLASRKSGGKFAAFGQREQAIYGFTGASLRSIDEIIEETGAIERPLSICYRCPKAIVEFAARMYPGIEPSPTAREGRIEYILDEEVETLAESGDMILSRVNAPLVAMCLALLRSGKRANVRGKNIGEIFTSLLTKVESYNKAFYYEELAMFVRQYHTAQLEELMRNEDENEAKIDKLNDGIKTLLVLHSAYEDYFTSPTPGFSDFVKGQSSASLAGFRAAINAFFTENKDALIILSTGHRAKGQEKRRVFFLGYDKAFKTRTEEDKIQAKNLDYVMVTRVLDDKDDEGSGVLFLVGEWDKNPVDFSIDPSYTGRFALVQEEIEEVSAPVQEIEAPVIVPVLKKRGRKAKQEEEKATYKQYSMSRDMVADIAAMSDMIDYSGKEGGIPESRMLRMIIESSPLYQEYLKMKEEGIKNQDRELVEAL